SDACEHRPDADGYERMRQRSIGVSKRVQDPFDPVGRERDRNEKSDWDGGALGFREERERGVACEQRAAQRVRRNSRSSTINQNQGSTSATPIEIQPSESF